MWDHTSEVLTRVEEIQDRGDHIDEVLKVDKLLTLQLDPTLGVPRLVYNWDSRLWVVECYSTHFWDKGVPGRLSPRQTGNVKVPATALCLTLHRAYGVLGKQIIPLDGTEVGCQGVAKSEQ